MTLNGHNLELSDHVTPAAGAAWVAKKDRLLIVRKTDKFELELCRWPGLDSLARKPVPSMVTMLRAGDKWVLLFYPPDLSAEETKNSVELRVVDDLSVVATFVEDSVGCFATHPDGSRVAIGHDFGDMNVWDTRKGTLSASHASPGVGGVAWSHDGALLAAKEFRGALKIFDSGDIGKKPLRTVKLGKETAIAFHPKQSIIAVADQQAVQMVNAETGQMEATIKGTKESARSIRQMVFSPDGTLLATGSRGENVVALWDIANSKFLGKVQGFDTPIAAVDFDATGKHLLVASFRVAEIYTIS